MLSMEPSESIMLATLCGVTPDEEEEFLLLIILLPSALKLFVSDVRAEVDVAFEALTALLRFANDVFVVLI